MDWQVEKLKLKVKIGEESLEDVLLYLKQTIKKMSKPLIKLLSQFLS